MRRAPETTHPPARPPTYPPPFPPTCQRDLLHLRFGQHLAGAAALQQAPGGPRYRATAGLADAAPRRPRFRRLLRLDRRRRCAGRRFRRGFLCCRLRRCCCCCCCARGSHRLLGLAAGVRVLGPPPLVLIQRLGVWQVCGGARLQDAQKRVPGQRHQRLRGMDGRGGTLGLQHGGCIGPSSAASIRAEQQAHSCPQRPHLQLVGVQHPQRVGVPEAHRLQRQPALRRQPRADQVCGLCGRRLGVVGAQQLAGAARRAHRPAAVGALLRHRDQRDRLLGHAAPGRAAGIGERRGAG